MLPEITEAEVIIDTLCEIRKEIASTLTVAQSVFKYCPCKELQNVMMDLESADQHLAGLIENGPTAPYADVPLIQSEDEDIWAEPKDGGQSVGDELMMSGQDRG